MTQDSLEQIAKLLPAMESALQIQVFALVLVFVLQQTTAPAMLVMLDRNAQLSNVILLLPVTQPFARQGVPALVQTNVLAAKVMKDSHVKAGHVLERVKTIHQFAPPEENVYPLTHAVVTQIILRLTVV